MNYAKLPYSFIKISLFLFLTVFTGIKFSVAQNCACAICGRSCADIQKYGHLPSCKYYNTPKSSGSPSSNPIGGGTALPPTFGTINSMIDILNTPTETPNNNVENEKQKKIEEEELRNKAIRDERHERVIKDMKALPDGKPKETTKYFAIVAECSGDNIEVKQNGVWRKLACPSNGWIINPSDSVKTGDNSTIKMNMLEDKITLLINPNSGFLIPDNNMFFSLELFYGRIRAEIKKLNKKLEVRTPSAVTSVRGTKFISDVSPDGATEILLYEGELEIETTGSKEKVILTAEKKIKITADGKVDTIEKVDLNLLKDLFKE